MSAKKSTRLRRDALEARLCRFRMADAVALPGFYGDEGVLPVDQAAELYADAEDVGLILPTTEDLLEVLPPAEGPLIDSLRDLARWAGGPGAEVVRELWIPLSEVQLLTPIPQPPKLFLLAGNYAEHIREGGGTTVERAETFPYVFMKPATALTHPGAPIVIPKCSPDHMDWECELGVIIGRRCRAVREEDALAHVAGYTVVNDISDRGFRPNPGRKPRSRDVFFDWLHGKWHDASCPVGPCVLAADALGDPGDLSLRLSVNDVVRQESSTAQMVFSVPAILAFLSSFVTLEPGDIISTGTPGGVGHATGTYLRPGDVVVAEIEGIGRLENPVIAEE